MSGADLSCNQPQQAEGHYSCSAPPSTGAQNCTAQAGGTAKSSFGSRAVSAEGNTSADCVQEDLALQLLLGKASTREPSGLPSSP